MGDHDRQLFMRCPGHPSLGHHTAPHRTPPPQPPNRSSSRARGRPTCLRLMCMPMMVDREGGRGAELPRSLRRARRSPTSQGWRIPPLPPPHPHLALRVGSHALTLAFSLFRACSLAVFGAILGVQDGRRVEVRQLRHHFEPLFTCVSAIVYHPICAV